MEIKVPPPQGLAGIVNQGDVELMVGPVLASSLPTQVRAQKKMLQRFEKTNEMLTNVNTLSATRCAAAPYLPRLERANNDFKKHTAMVVDMKKDLDSIFKRIRGIKAKLARQMPEAYGRAGVEEQVGEEDDEYDEAIRRRKEAEARAAEAKEEEGTNDGVEKEVEEATEKLKL